MYMALMMLEDRNAYNGAISTWT